MSRKTKNTLILLGFLVGLAVVGFAYIFFIQQSEIKSQNAKLLDLKSLDYDPDALKVMVNEKSRRVDLLDSILAARKFNIPISLSPLRFYDFMNDLGPFLSEDAKYNIEYKDRFSDGQFYYYEYRIVGTGTFNDLYQIIYGIEQSRNLKKVKTINLTNFISSRDLEAPKFIVSYTLEIAVYFSNDDRFFTSGVLENELKANKLHDIFYPLIQTEISPNVDELLDIQGSRLLGLVPEGAFVVDSKGMTHLLIEGDKVYLGFLTQIDYKNNKCMFVLDKGGIIENITLELEKEIKKTTEGK